MNTFYKRAWEILFILFYPFITLFSLLFIGLVSLISALSRLFTSKPATQAETTEEEGVEWKPFVQHHGVFLSRKPVHQVQFGPVLYHFKANHNIPGLEHSFWSDFQVPIGEGFLLQRWPSIAEHELEQFELVYVRPGLDAPVVVQSMPTFYWQVQEHSHEEVDIIWTEDEVEKRIFVAEEQLP